MSDLSVILVTYRSSATIAACLTSLFDHAGDLRLHVIVIDNHSADATVDRVRDCLAAHGDGHRVQIVCNPTNRGFGPAVNQGLAIADAPMCLLLNPDTVVPAGTLQRLLAFYAAHADAGLIGPQLRSPDGTVVPSCREFPGLDTLLWDVTGLARLFRGHRRLGRWRMGYFDHRTSRAVDQPMGACLLVSAALVRAVGGIDERFRMFFNDVDWCRRMVAAERCNYFVADTHVLHHRGHSARQRPLAMIWYSHYEYFLYLWKWARAWWQRPLNVAALLVLLGTAGLRSLWVLVAGRR